jgi:hypothetical protein
MPHVARARNGLCWSGLDSARDARTARRAGRRQVVIATHPACDSEGNLDFLETEKRSRSEDIATARTLPCVSLGSRGSIRWTVGVVCFAEELVLVLGFELHAQATRTESHWQQRFQFENRPARSTLS